MPNAITHFRTICCLGLPLRTALMVMARAVREIVPSDWTRIGLNDASGMPTVGYGEHPDFLPLFFSTFESLLSDPHSLYANYHENFIRGTVGATLDLQGAKYLASRHYRELEKPLDSCWLLEAALVQGGRTVGSMALSRPRSATPFGQREVDLLTRIRPWIAHALTGPDEETGPDDGKPETAPLRYSAGPVLDATIVLSQEGRLLFQTSGAEQLTYMLDGTADRWRSRVPRREKVPPAIRTLVRTLTDTARGRDTHPPKLAVACAWGLIMLRADWLVPREEGVTALVSDLSGVPVAVHLSLREPAAAHAVRRLRDLGATPAQVRVGVQLALGKSKAEVARAVGVKLSSIEDATRKLYSRMQVHNASEFAARLWLSEP